MRVLADIPIAQVVVDRSPMARTLGLVRHLEAGGTVPPIHVKLLANGRYRILDGRHRILAFKLLQRTTITARYGVAA